MMLTARTYRAGIMSTADLNVFQGSYRKLHRKLMLSCEVSKIADMIVATTLPDHLHFYCIYLIKARITTKEKL